MGQDAAAHHARVDPRGCGGDKKEGIIYSVGLGRSPRVRGRRSFVRDQNDVSRSIPAGAGETVTDSWRHSCSSVDPRGCGGDTCSGVAVCWVIGRSPRVRGRPPVGSVMSYVYGSIPAGAGETDVLASEAIETGVDPRGCGGDSRCVLSRTIMPGRSPRVRGRLRCDPDITQSERSIPAGAGETRLGGYFNVTGTVDPRGCGGDGMMGRTAGFEWGRSPRVRGRRFHRDVHQDRRGSIPAGAGET